MSCGVKVLMLLYWQKVALWTVSNGIVSCLLNSTVNSSKIAIVYRSAVQNAEISIIVYRAMPVQAHGLSADAVELVLVATLWDTASWVHSPYDTIS